MRFRPGLKIILRLLFCGTIVALGFYFMNVVVPGPGRYINPADFYPTWYATRTVMQSRDPYSAEVTRNIQTVIYGETDSRRNEQRFAYPLFAVLPAIPLAFFSFPTVLQVCFWGGIVLAIASAWLWCRCVGFKFDMVLCALVLAAPPVSLGIVLRQPTVLYLFLLALAAYLFKREKYMMAGILSALASAKPQLAIFVLVPLVVLTLVNWRKRAPFVIAYTASMIALLGASFALQPNWWGEWMETLRAYRSYGKLIEPYNAALFLPVYLWLWKNRRTVLFQPLQIQLLFLAPTAVIGAGYLTVVLSCLFAPLAPWSLLFFKRAGLFLAIETPLIAYLIWKTSRKTAEENLQLFAHSY
jgi:hypothetical protein